MTVTKVTCSKSEVAYITLPPGLVRQHISDLKPGENYANKYIQGFVSTKYDVQYKRKKPYLLKFILDEKDSSVNRTSNQAINVFSFGDVVKDLLEIKTGTLMFLAGFTVEKSSRAGTGHPYQVCVDETGGNIQIWVIEYQEPVSGVSYKMVNQEQRSETSRKKPKVPNYTYTTLDNLQVNTCVNIYAVVKFCKAPYRTRGTDYCQVISVVDHTCDELTKLKCLFFIRPPADPPPVKVGSIVRFHRLKVINHNGDLQGNNGPGFSWLVFKGEEGASLSPETSSPKYTLTDSDTEKVLALRKWATGVEEINQNTKPSTLGDLSPGKYSNIVVQVVSTCVIEVGVCLLLKVWDGTKLLYPVREIDTGPENCDPDTDVVLEELAQGFIYDVCLFDDHSRNGSRIKPGDLIELRNLHAAVFKNTETRDEYNALQTVELVVHKGTSYGRGVFKASPGTREVTELTKRLVSIKVKVRQNNASRGDNSDGVPVSGVSRSYSEPASNVIHDVNSVDVSEQNNTESGEVHSSSSGLHGQNRKGESVKESLGKTYRQSDEKNQSDKRAGLEVLSSPELQLSCDPSQEAISQVSHVGDQADRCMMKTATVLTAHQHVKRSTLLQVKDQKVPYKFRIMVKLMDYQPKAETPENLVKLYCPVCNYLMCPKLKTAGRIPRIRCLKCNDSPNWELDCTQFMEYTYVLKFLLGDGKDFIVVHLWRENATEFFRGIKPEKILRDKESFYTVKEDLCNLMKNGQSKPHLECCIKSYSGTSGTNYQMFDTSLV